MLERENPHSKLEAYLGIIEALTWEKYGLPYLWMPVEAVDYNIDARVAIDVATSIGLTLEEIENAILIGAYLGFQEKVKDRGYKEVPPEILKFALNPSWGEKTSRKPSLFQRFLLYFDS